MESSEEFKFPPNTVHVVRTAQQIHAQLSQMADQKANMLLAATFLVFTIAVGQIRGTQDPLPLMILGAAAFLSAVLAILTVMPSIRYDTGGKLNILFFGSFTTLPEDEFLNRFVEAVRSEEGYLRLMARDLYQNGVVLERKKYRLLSWAYRVFLVGLVASAAAFIVGYVR